MISTCAYYGDVSAIRYLLSQGERLEALGPNLGLDGAAFHGHWRLCEFLLESGADANYADPGTGETAFHAALCTTARPGCAIAVDVLLNAGANPTRTTKPGVETGGFMRDCRTKGETARHRAAAFANVETIQRLLDAGATIDARDVNGDTPLAGRVGTPVLTRCSGNCATADSTFAKAARRWNRTCWASPDDEEPDQHRTLFIVKDRRHGSA